MVGDSSRDQAYDPDASSVGAGRNAPVAEPSGCQFFGLCSACGVRSGRGVLGGLSPPPFGCVGSTAGVAFGWGVWPAEPPLPPAPPFPPPPPLPLLPPFPPCGVGPPWRSVTMTAELCSIARSMLRSIASDAVVLPLSASRAATAVRTSRWWSSAAATQGLEVAVAGALCGCLVGDLAIGVERGLHGGAVAAGDPGQRLGEPGVEPIELGGGASGGCCRQGGRLDPHPGRDRAARPAERPRSSRRRCRAQTAAARNGMAMRRRRDAA